MMLQLKRAGVLDKISGFIFGNCVNCCSKQELDDVLDKFIKPLGILAWSGAMVGAYVRNAHFTCGRYGKN